VDVLDYYIRLFTAPADIQTTPQILLVTAAILIPAVVLALLMAMILLLVFRSFEEHLGTFVAVSLAWAWAAIAVATLVMIDMVVLMWRASATSWLALAPHSIVVWLAAVSALWIYFRCWRELKTSQDAIYLARKER
jgi:hypothetical protein